MAQARPAEITGSVIGEGARPVAGATVEVVRPGVVPRCEARTAADGTFAMSCDVTGRFAVRASLGQLAPWQHDDVDLGSDRSIHLNFMLAAARPPIAATPETAADVGFFSRPLANPVLGTLFDRPFTRRLLGILLAVGGFVLGAFLMLTSARHLRVETRRLSGDEAADLVVNARNRLGERQIPVAYGAVGAEARVSYGAEELAAALAGGRYGVVAVSLLAPLLVAVAAVGFGLAILVGQPMYLFLGMMVVASGFVVTPIIITVQALSRNRRPS